MLFYTLFIVISFFSVVANEIEEKIERVSLLSRSANNGENNYREVKLKENGLNIAYLSDSNSKEVSSQKLLDSSGIFIRLKDKESNNKKPDEEWTNSVEENWNNLVKEFQKRKEQFPGAKKGSRTLDKMHTPERILISLTTLLNKICTCAAAIIGPDQRLWIAYNNDDRKTKKKLEEFFNILKVLMSDEVIFDNFHRKSIIKEEKIKKILKMCVDEGRVEKISISSAFVKNADKLSSSIKKLLKLKNYNGQDKQLKYLINALKNEKISYYSGGEKREGEKFLNSKLKIHAEMNLIQALKDAKKPEKKYFIAISRTCCRKCSSALEAFNLANSKIILAAGGCHENDYLWPIPKFIEEEKFLQKFLGEDCYKTYKKARQKNMYLDFISKVTKKGKKDTREPITTTDSQSKLVEEKNGNGEKIKHRKREISITTVSRQ